MNEETTNQNKENNFDRLTKMIGEQDDSLGGFVSGVIEEVKKQKEEKIKEQVKNLIIKAMEIQEKMDQIDKDYKSQKAKWDKELGKLLGKLGGNYNKNLNLNEIK